MGAKFKVDPLAQSVEHNTFNVGVLGSSPKRITEKRDFLGLSFLCSWALTQGGVQSLHFVKASHLEPSASPYSFSDLICSGVSLPELIYSIMML